LREIQINGYIDDEVWFGDEATPESVHAALYGEKNELADDVHIRMNSFGGLCNAAVRIHDDIRAYPGNVKITVSGTAASAGTVLAMAADRLEMTPGSLWMVHDPSTFAWGNERDLTEALNLLRACKESILNVYSGRCPKSREEVAAMMTAATWMDANQALEEGFIDGITEDAPPADPSNTTGPHPTNRKDAEAKVQAWLDRRKRRPPTLPPENAPTLLPDQPPSPENTGIPIGGCNKTPPPKAKNPFISNGGRILHLHAPPMHLSEQKKGVLCQGSCQLSHVMAD